MTAYNPLDPQSCFLCQKGGKLCDKQRPCSECKRLRMSHMCMGIELEAKAQKLAREAMDKARAQQQTRPTPASIPVKQTGVVYHTVAGSSQPRGSVVNEKKRKRQPRAANPSAISVPTPVPLITHLPSPSITSPDYMRIDSPVLELPPSHTNPLANTATITPPSSSASVPRVMDISTEVPVFSTTEGQLVRRPAQGLPVILAQGGASDFRLDDAAIDEIAERLDHTSITSPEEQKQTIVLLLNELKKLRQDHLRVAQELFMMKQRYESSATSPLLLGQDSQAHPTPREAATAATVAANAVAGSFADPNTPTVLFDVTRNPATVIACNERFCQTFGYRMDQVVNSPWTKFVFPAYHERTVALLQQRGAYAPTTGADLVSSIQFVQAYRRFDGTFFQTVDTHTFFLDPTTHQERVDLVTLASDPAPIPSPSDRSFVAIIPTQSTTDAAKRAVANIYNKRNQQLLAGPQTASTKARGTRHSAATESSWPAASDSAVVVRPGTNPPSYYSTELGAPLTPNSAVQFNDPTRVQEMPSPVKASPPHSIAPSHPKHRTAKFHYKRSQNPGEVATGADAIAAAAFPTADPFIVTLASAASADPANSTYVSTAPGLSANSLAGSDDMLSISDFYDPPAKRARHQLGDSIGDNSLLLTDYDQLVPPIPGTPPNSGASSTSVPPTDGGGIGVGAPTDDLELFDANDDSIFSLMNNAPTVTNPTNPLAGSGNAMAVDDLLDPFDPGNASPNFLVGS